MTELISFDLDGHEAAIAAPVEETLLDVLRNRLGVMSVREACGIGICGSCTVDIEGRQVSSCLILAGQVAGRHVQTLEALERESTGDDPGGDRQLHPIQQAFIDHNAFQCSYCTPGFLMATRELLALDQDPSLADVRTFLAGNLCRCGSYRKIEEAVLDAAARIRGQGTSEQAAHDSDDGAATDSV